MSIRGHIARVAVIGGAALAALCAASWMPGSAVADAPSPSFSVDAIPGGSVDATRGVPVGSKFSVAVVLDTLTGSEYQSYQVTLVYDDVELDGDTGLPGNWSDAPVADVSGGNLAVFPNGPLCDPSPTTGSVTSEDDAGNGEISMTCADVATDGRSTYTGALVEFVLTCTDAGTATLSLSDINNTFVLDGTQTSLLDHTHTATITCGGDPAPTSTAGAATATPAAATATPGGAEPTAVPPTSVATPPTGIGGPDTGTGEGDPARAGTAFAMAAGLSVLGGAALVALGMARRRSARR